MKEVIAICWWVRVLLNVLTFVRCQARLPSSAFFANLCVPILSESLEFPKSNETITGMCVVDSYLPILTNFKSNLPGRVIL